MAADDDVWIIVYCDVLDGISKSYLMTAEFEPAP